MAALAFPLVASAGWGNAPYDKTECTYSKESNILSCETTFTVVVENKTEQFGVTDEACPSGTRLIRRTGTFSEPWMSFDFFEGHSPNANPNANKHLGGQSNPTGPGVWTNFTDTDLGCL